MKLIKINPDHYIIVDDSDIKEGDFVYDSKDKVIRFVKRYLKDDWIKKITHSTMPLIIDFVTYRGTLRETKKSNLSLSEVKELIGKVDLEKKAEQVFPYKETRTDFATEECREIYKIGYKQALEDNKDKKYTEKEVFDLMCKAFEQGFKKANVVDAGLEGKETDTECEWILKVYRRPKTEWEVEFIDGKLKLK